MVTLVNRAYVSTATTGTGAVTLGVAKAGFQDFAAAGVTNGAVVSYTIVDGSNWEIGTGTYSSTGPTLTRTPSQSSNGGAAINLSGDAAVFITAAAEDIQQPPSEGPFVDGDKTKLDGIETGADVTDAGNVDPLVDSHLNVSTATSDQLLSWTGSDYDWIDSPSPELYAENPSSPTAPSATGTNAVAIGSGATAVNTFGIAIGPLANAGSYAIALGYNANASGESSFAGYDGTASGLSSIAIGGTSVASGTSSMALGYGTDATEGSSTAVGRNAQARASNANAFGKDSYAIGNQATAIGDAYASGADSFAAAIANNTSSYGATGNGSIAMGKRASASDRDTIAIGQYTSANWSENVVIGAYASSGGVNSTAIGPWSSSNATFSTAIGDSSSATGHSSAAMGYLAEANNDSSLALGSYAKATKTNSAAIGTRSRVLVDGQISFGNGQWTSQGDSQSSLFILRSDTTDATPEALTTNNGAAATTNQIIPPNNSAYSFSGTIIARQQASAGSEYASWEIKGALLRDGTAATTVLGNGIKNKLYASAGASAWDVSLTADTTNGGLAITVTGAAATNIRWVATVNTSEVTY